MTRPSRPVVQARTLVTDDGVPIDAIHLPGSKDLAVVLAHGFTLSWQRDSVWQVATRLNRAAGVVTFDFRGHGRSGGLSTLGDREIKDLDVAIAYARELGYQRVAAVGFSMGASIVVRYAGLVGGLDAAVSVSGPGRWYYRGTLPMRRVHWAVERRAGRMLTRAWLKTRVSPVSWDPVPVPPAEAAAQIAPIPFLVVHGDKDLYFPADHAHQLYQAAREPRELWIVPGFAHAESGAGPELIDRIGCWVREATGLADGSLAAGRAQMRDGRALAEEGALADASLPTSSPAAGGPVGNGPAGDGPVGTGNGPAGNGPVRRGPAGTGNGPAGDGPVRSGPVVTGTGPVGTGNGPAGDGPAGDGPVRNGPAGTGNGPAGDGPVGDGPADPAGDSAASG